MRVENGIRGERRYYKKIASADDLLVAKDPW